MTTVGILGGGQLARMMILAGAPLGLRFKVLDPAVDACAGQLAPLTVGDYADKDALARFIDGVDAVSFDFENVPAQAVAWLAAHVPVFPPPAALAVAQDRLSEKTLFRELRIPVAPFADITSLDDLNEAVDALGLPCILKTRRFGYDGKGQVRIRSRDDVALAWAELGPQVGKTGLILEGFVAFQCELSVIAVRGRDGEFRAWPVTRNWHVDGVLSASLAPAAIPASLQQRALEYAQRLADTLDYVGVFALELFCRDGELLANEMAPRVHNSGHWTQDGSPCSQFENHLRAGLGLPLGDTGAFGMTCMLNWLGTMPDPMPVLHEAGGHWHDYGKAARSGRKVGHANLRADTHEALASSLTRVGEALGRQAQVIPVIESF